MYAWTSKGAHFQAIIVRTIDSNQCFIRGPTLLTIFECHGLCDIFRHLLPLLILPVSLHNVAYIEMYVSDK